MCNITGYIVVGLAITPVYGVVIGETVFRIIFY